MFRLFKKSTDKNTAKEEPDKIQNCENSDAAVHNIRIRKD